MGFTFSKATENQKKAVNYALWKLGVEYSDDLANWLNEKMNQLTASAIINAFNHGEKPEVLKLLQNNIKTSQYE